MNVEVSYVETHGNLKGIEVKEQVRDTMDKVRDVLSAKLVERDLVARERDLLPGDSGSGVVGFKLYPTGRSFRANINIVLTLRLYEGRLEDLRRVYKLRVSRSALRVSEIDTLCNSVARKLGRIY